MSNIERSNMAEGGSTPEAGPQAASQVVGEPKILVVSKDASIERPGILGRFFRRPRLQVLVKPEEHQAVANASLNENERIKTVGDLLGSQLTPKQEQAIIKAHNAGAGEPGKEGEAGIYNYTQAQLKEKAKILKQAGFTREQRRSLMESGIAGIAPPDQFTTIEPDTFEGKLQPIMRRVKKTGEEGRADEGFLNRIVNRIEGLIDQGDAQVDPVRAEEVIGRLDELRLIAASEPSPGQVSPDNLAAAMLESLQQQATALTQQNLALRQELNILRQQILPEQPDLTEDAELLVDYPQSAFGDVMRRLAAAKLMPDQTLQEQTVKQAGINEAERLRDELVEEAHSEHHLFELVKPSLFTTFYESRVEVTYRDKVNKRRADGGPGILYNLENQRLKANRGSWEGQRNFWANPQRQNLEQKFAGIVDYFNRESLSLIIDVVKDRDRYRDLLYRPNDRYPIQKLVDIWSYRYEAPNLEPETALNFDDVRDIIEAERKLRPEVPNKGDYETWILLVADSPREAEELIPQIVGSIQAKLTGSPQEKLGTIQEESRKWPKAIDRLRKELRRKPGDPEFRRLTSILINEIRLMGIEYFSEMVHETWDPFLSQEADFAREFRDAKDHDHIVDGMYFDRTGTRAAAFESYAANDWQIFRYGINSRITFDTAQIGDMEARIQATELKIEDWLVKHELRLIDELLGLSENSVIHPAFQRIRDKLDALDKEDMRVYRYLRDSNDTESNTDPEFDVSGHNPTNETRWREYIRKAREWQRTGKMGDSRDKLQRVLFQHPLARVLWPESTDAQGNIIPDEFWSMYREIPRNISKKHRDRKREEVKTIMASVRRGIRATMLDANASGPRLSFEVEKTENDTLTSEMGKIVQDQQGNYRLEITPTLSVPIEFDSEGKPIINAVIPLLTLEREVMRWIVETDGKKPPKRHMIKLFRVLRDKVGIDLAVPSFSAWYWGAHDTNRPHLLPYLTQIREYEEHIADREKMRKHDSKEGDSGWGFGADYKTALSRMPEDERRLGIIALIWIKNKFTHKNYPGQDDMIKEFRNILFQEWGISQGTVQVNGLIKGAHLGETHLLRAFGCQTWRQFVGLLKGPDEIVFQQTKGFFASPRDAQNWVERFGAIVEQAKLWTGRGGGKEGQGPGILIGGPISGAFHLRVMNVILSHFSKSGDQGALNQLAYKDPDEAYKVLTEGAYEKYVEIASKVVGPLMTVMESRKKLENVYGQNPQTAWFLNTLLWYDVLNWMEERPDEFREKFGYAYDADLNLARVFMHTVLYESRLIYSDKQWDEIILGYTIHKDRWQDIQQGKKRGRNQNPIKRFIRYKVDASDNTLGYDVDKKDSHKYSDYDGKSDNIVPGETIGGLIDALPPEMRKDLIEKKWLPVGINSHKPEDLDLLMQDLNKSSERNREIYSELFKVAKVISQPRREISRP